jgi:hypothetical protein
MLFTHWERRYPYLSSAMPLAEEGLLVPFYVNGKAVGTIWVEHVTAWAKIPQCTSAEMWSPSAGNGCPVEPLFIFCQQT